MERKKIGEVFHYYGHIGVAAIRLTDGGVAIGDKVQIQGPSTNVEQTVDSLQIEHAVVSRADRGQEVGMKVSDRVRENDFVYKVVSEEPPVPPPPRVPPPPPPVVPSAPKPARPKAKPKPRAKKPARPRRKGPRKAKPRSRKTSRARRSKARRESRRPRSR